MLIILAVAVGHSMFQIYKKAENDGWFDKMVAKWKQKKGGKK